MKNYFVTRSSPVSAAGFMCDELSLFRESTLVGHHGGLACRRSFADFLHQEFIYSCGTVVMSVRPNRDKVSSGPQNVSKKKKEKKTSSGVLECKNKAHASRNLG
jgi:hypothetical protein